VSNPILLGYDRDNDRVYVDPTTGRLCQADTMHEAKIRFGGPDNGVDATTYISTFGPITKKARR